MGVMVRRTAKKSFRRSSREPIDWLPFDSRLLPLFSFPHVRGVARIFLLVEMSLCVLVVAGTFLVAISQLLQ